MQSGLASSRRPNVWHSRRDRGDAHELTKRQACEHEHSKDITSNIHTDKPCHQAKTMDWTWSTGDTTDLDSRRTYSNCSIHASKRLNVSYGATHATHARTCTYKKRLARVRPHMHNQDVQSQKWCDALSRRSHTDTPMREETRAQIKIYPYKPRDIKCKRTDPTS